MLVWTYASIYKEVGRLHYYWVWDEEKNVLIKSGHGIAAATATVPEWSSQNSDTLSLSGLCIAPQVV